METEKWKPIPGFSKYEVSNLGRIRSLNYKNSGQVKILKPNTSRGYLSVGLVSDYGTTKSIRVHRLVMLAFIGPSKLDVNHINCIKSDNRLINLEYCTESENIKHAIANGMQIVKKGIEHGGSKLSREAVIEIRLLASQNRHYGAKKLAKRFNVSRYTIINVVKNRTYVDI